VPDRTRQHVHNEIPAWIYGAVVLVYVTMDQEVNRIITRFKMVDFDAWYAQNSMRLRVVCMYFMTEFY
ncbi:uncharacterized protein METZ01_LOCUS12196, partial [marine metagenome]|jgi:hypothetical protein